jgi:hypothetical protein
MRKLYHIKDFIEWKAFGVCAAIGERMGVARHVSGYGSFTFHFLL